MIPLLWVPDLEAVLIALCIVFGPGVLLLAAGALIWQHTNDSEETR